MVLLWAAHPDLVVLTAALQCSLPVISLNNPDVLEYAGDAAVYVDDETVDALSAAMIQLYKDEDLHARLKEAGKNRGALLNRNEYEMRFWRILETAACS
jgi:glycosyltransferase involved in cell wall biosynthesis